MVAFLSDGWLAELDRVASAAKVPDHLDVVVQQVVLDDQGGDVAYVVRITGGRVRVTPGRASDADVTFTQDRATAQAIAMGAMSAQVAFLSGQLRVGGDIREIMERSGDLTSLDDLFGPARAATTW